MNHNRNSRCAGFPSRRRGCRIRRWGGRSRCHGDACRAGRRRHDRVRCELALRRRVPALTLDGRSVSVLSTVLDCDKDVSRESVPTSPMVTVVDRCEGSGPLSDMPVDEYLDHVHAENRAVWVTLSPYGLTGPRRRWRGTELTIAAAGGLLSSVTDSRTGWPIKLAGNQALLSAGQVASLATCHGIGEFTRTGEPVHIDVSAQEAVVVTGPLLRVTNILLNSAGETGARRYGAPAGYYQCRDGLVRISVMEDHQWTALVRAIDAPAVDGAIQRRPGTHRASRRTRRQSCCGTCRLVDDRVRAQAPGGRRSHRCYVQRR